jgi:hypothetical protein
MRLGLILSSPDDATSSIYPEIEVWIQGGANRQTALGAIAGSDEMDSYRSYMDFLVCQVFSEIRPYCFSFYQGKGEQVKEMITLEGRDKMVFILWIACEIALLAHENNVSYNWKQVRRLLEMQPEWDLLWGVKLTPYPYCE